ncbi:MAG: DsrE/DsrF/TusD sulfur relay family protein [Alphaproteobacteria bacterium]
MKYLFILNDPPYGTERTFNGLRLARSLASSDKSDVRVFLIGDAAATAMAGQNAPKGYYNLGDMLGMVLRRGGAVAVCGTCMDARGIESERLIKDAQRSTMEELTEWSEWADKILIF